MALTKVTNSMIFAAPINVLDYMTPAQITAVQTNSWVGVPDVTAAIQAALDSVPNGPNSYAPSKTTGGAGRVTLLFPNGVYLVSDTLDCSQRDYVQWVGEGRAEIYSTSTEYIVDMSSTDHCTMTNIALYSPTARVGIYIDRCTSAPFAQFNRYDNVSITLETDTTANGGNGRIGIWNGRGELNVFSNIIVKADLPMFATLNADANFAPVSGTLELFIRSSVQVLYLSCQWITYTVHSPCTVLIGCVAHEFYGNYWRTDNTAIGTAPYGVIADGISNCIFTGTVEILPSFMLVRGAILYFNKIDLAFQNNLDGRGIIQLEDVSNNVGYIAGSVHIGISGAIPAGSAVIKGSTASLSNTVKGVEITSISTLPAVLFSSTNSTVSGNIVTTEAGAVITGTVISAERLTSPLSGEKIATASGTPITIVATEPFACYQVFAFLFNGGANFVTTATFINDGTNLIILNYAPGAFLTLTVSGANIQATQSSGSANDIIYKVIKIQ